MFLTDVLVEVEGLYLGDSVYWVVAKVETLVVVSV